jgi:hypothetical protein
VKLTFEGIAKYSIIEYVPNGDGWKVGNVVQVDGNSADARTDEYALTPLAKGERRLVAVGANMSSATGDEDVSMTVTFTQGGDAFYSDKQSGHDSGDIVVLWSRTVFVGN